MLNYERVPVDYMVDGIRDYMEKGIRPGDFLQALLSNDLKKTVMHADGTNIAYLPHWVSWLYTEAPMGSWGSPAKMEKWIYEMTSTEIFKKH